MVSKKKKIFYKEVDDVSLNFQMNGILKGVVDEQEKLQRTEDWFESRKGKFTGSKIKDLMSCGRSTAKLAWDDLKKIVDFGKVSERYIYNVGMERITGVRSMQSTSKQMDWGSENEGLLIKQLIDDEIISNFHEMGFEICKSYKNLGASVDGLCVVKTKKDKVCALELKCCVSWDGHYNRMYEEVTEKHQDFWQFQTEMMSVDIDLLLYVVAYPMTVEKYDFNDIIASKVHQQAIIKRCKIADRAIELWNKHKIKKTALEVACNEFLNNEI